MLGTYQVPKAAVTVAATLQSVPGPLVAANYTAPNALVQPSEMTDLLAGRYRIDSPLGAGGMASFGHPTPERKFSAAVATH
jgi:hypothetical protein